MIANVLESGLPRLCRVNRSLEPALAGGRPVADALWRRRAAPDSFSVGSRQRKHHEHRRFGQFEGITRTRDWTTNGPDIEPRFSIGVTDDAFWLLAEREPAIVG